MHFLAFFEKYFGLNKASNFSIFANLAIWQQAHKNRNAIRGLFDRNRFNLCDRGKTKLFNSYAPADFYTLNGRISLDNLLVKYRSVGLKPYAMLEMTRGCKNNCDFCALNRKRFGCFSRSTETVLAEAQYLAAKGIDRFHIIDPTFGIVRKKTDELLGGLVNFHTDYPNAEIEVLLRSDMATKNFVERLAAAGITKADLGMESMDDDALGAVKKQINASATYKAVEILHAAGIRVKLFHILFPDRLSRNTLLFFLELAERKINFTVQSSFLRKLPAPNSPPRFLEQDQTVFVLGIDTPEQLMEYMLANLAFPSMDWNKPDLELRNSIRKIFYEGGDLKDLFKVKKTATGFCMKIQGEKNYTYVHPERPEPVNFCIEGGR